MSIWQQEQGLVDEARRLKTEHRYTNRAIAEYFTNRYNRVFTEEQVRSALRRAATRDLYAEARGQRFPVAPKPRTFGKPLSIDVDFVTVIADLHAPYHSGDMLNKMLTMSEFHRSEHLVIAGDLFNFDSVSSWPITHERDSFQEEIRAAGAVIRELSRYFKSICIVNGNHDERLGRRLEANISLEDLVTMALGREPVNCDLYVSDFDYMYAQVNGQPWVFGHLSTHRRRPGEAAKKIALKHQANVAVGHDHIQGFTSTEDGEFLCISIGAMIDVDEEGKSPLWYKERRLTDFPDIKNGFLVVADGVPWLYNSKGLSSLNGGVPYELWYARA